MATPPTIVSSYPVHGFSTFPVSGAPIEIILDAEIDLSSAILGVFLDGPNGDLRIGANSAINFSEAGANPLADYGLTPAYGSEQEAQVEVIKIEADNSESAVQATYNDTEELRHLIRVTPTRRLRESTEYTLWIAGTSESYSDTSISRRSVFDAEANPANIGMGSVYSSGTYGGAAADTLNVSVVTAGSAASMQFEWWYSSTPLDVKTVTSYHGIMELEDGIFLTTIGSDATSFQAGDSWTVSLREAAYLAATAKIVFGTAVDTVTNPSTPISTSPIGISDLSIIDVDPTDPTAVTALEAFALSSITPKSMSSNQTLNTRQIIATFNKDLATGTGVQNVRVQRKSVTGAVEQTDVPFSVIVSGSKLYINLVREEA